MSIVSYTEWPPGMSAHTYYFLRGVSAAIDVLRSRNRHGAALRVIEDIPSVRQIRHPGAPKINRDTLYDAGEEVVYDSAGNVWMVPMPRTSEGAPRRSPWRPPFPPRRPITVEERTRLRGEMKTPVYDSGRWTGR